MRIKKGFELRKIGNENIVVASGMENINFNSIISMNSSSAWLWEQIAEKEFNADMLAEFLMDKYNIDAATAQQDAEEIAKQWIAAGITE